MSDELKQFYRELWAWIQGDCPEHETFDKCYAICGNLETWMGPRILLTRENMDLLLDVVGDRCFPFNSPAEDFAKEHRDGSFYQNPKRLAFIEEQAK